MTHKLKHTMLVLVALLSLAGLVMPVSVFADTTSLQGICATSGYQWDNATGKCNDGSLGTTPVPLSPTTVTTTTTVSTPCADGEYLKGSTTVCCPKGSGGSGMDCVIAKYINPIVKLLSVAAGIAVVIGVIMGGVQYSASAGDPQKAAQAKGKITKALLGLVAFLFLYSALQFFSPGGISTTSTIPSGSGSVAARCSKPFLGLKPWFAYLPDSAFDTANNSCSITNFSLLGDSNTSSQILPVFLVVADDLVRIAGLVAVAFVITGGIQLVTSQAEPDKTKRARETIISALVGVAVAIIAASVVAYIGSRLSS